MQVKLTKKASRIGRLDRDNPAIPRVPERANGRRRYALLIAAAEQILAEDGTEALTIQRIAQVASVPMASVYHFFPSPSAAAIAVAESYFSAFVDTVEQAASSMPSGKWREAVIRMMCETVAFYQAHPYASRLVFGSDYSWNIRQVDVANNMKMAETLTALIGSCFSAPADIDLAEIFAIGIGLSDAVWSLSIARYGDITPAYAKQAEAVILNYLAQFEKV
jgi:AcrR family transcriptional regulator